MKPLGPEPQELRVFEMQLAKKNLHKNGKQVRMNKMHPKSAKKV